MELVAPIIIAVLAGALGLAALCRVAVRLATGRRVALAHASVLVPAAATIALAVIFLAGALGGPPGLAAGIASALVLGWPILWLSFGLGPRGGARAWGIFVLLLAAAAPVAVGLVSLAARAVFP